MKPYRYKRKAPSASPSLSVLPKLQDLGPSAARDSLIQFRPYQRAAFENRANGIEIWLWGRQTGKSFTLAAWAVDRLIQNPGRLVTVLSNSKVNGMELNRRCGEVCHLMGQAFEQVDLSQDNRFETMNCETRIRIRAQVGRIKVLAASARTARGFSGDLILDEFAFHENANAIWEAAEPILAANRDYLCRIASTANGKHNLFYRLCTNPNIPLRKVTRADAYAQGCPIFHPVTREPIDPAAARELAPNKRAYDQNYECAFADENMALLTHELISAAEDPAAGVVCDYDWSPAALSLINSSGLLLIPENLRQSAKSADNPPLKKPARVWLAESDDQAAIYRDLLVNVCNGSIDRLEELLNVEAPISLSDRFDYYSFARLRSSHNSADPRPSAPSTVLSGPRSFFAGVDVGRHRDRTVITVVERSGGLYYVRAILRLDEMRLPQQQERLEAILRIPEVRVLKIDITGLGLGLFEYTQQKFPERVHGINFASTISASSLNSRSIRIPHCEIRNGSIRVTEALATQLLQIYEDRAIRQPIDLALRDDLRKPERLLSPSGRVSIAASRDGVGHADHFWSLALALDASKIQISTPFFYHSFTPSTGSRTVTL